LAGPAPVEVRVEDGSERGGAALRLGWRISLGPAAEGRPGLLRLRFEEVEPLAFQGRELAEPRERTLLLAALATSVALPDLLVDPTGRIVGAVGQEERIAAFLAALRRGPGALEPERLATLEEALAAPALQQELAQRAAEMGKVWVGTWAGRDLPAGTVRTETLDFPLPDGRVLRVPLEVANQGPVTEPEGHVLLVTEAVVEGPEAREALGRSLAGVARRAGREPLDPEEVALFRRLLRAEVVTNPATLQPWRAETLSRVEVVLRDGRTSVQEERHRYRFSWP